MRSILVIIFTLIATTLAITKLDKLSTEDALDVLSLMDQVDQHNETNAKSKILELTDLEYNPLNYTMRQMVLAVLDANVHQTSIYAKVIGLITFTNIISVLMVPVGLIFLFSFFGDIIKSLAIIFGQVFLKLFMNRRLIYALLLSFTTPLLYFKYDDPHYITKFFILGWATPLFGCFLLGITLVAMYFDISIYSVINKESGATAGYNTKADTHNLMNIMYVILTVWLIAAVYHNNWLIGVATIMLLFFINGFMYGSVTGGFYLGFNNEDSLSRCLETSTFLNIFTLGCKIFCLNEMVQNVSSVFETGVFFWATFVGALSLLILSEEFYLQYRLKDKYTKDVYMLTNILMAVYCIVLMFMGNVLNINSYKNIGGTFLVFWGISIERKIWSAIGSRHMTLATGLILVNLYIIRELMLRFPEYCIF